MSVPTTEYSTTRQEGHEPIPGYRLVRKLGEGGFGEVWKCTAPGGLAKAIKFITIGNDGLKVDDWAASKEFRAIEQVKAIRHPYLLGLDRVELRDDELLMVMEFADQTIQDLFDVRKLEGLPGIPLSELLPIAAEASEALDLLAEHGLQHLDVKPGNVMLIGGHAKLGDFGLVGSVGAQTAENDDRLVVTAKYAAPEVLEDNVTKQTDQYSFAVVLYELITGLLPYSAKSSNEMLMLHMSGVPDLSAVSPSAAAVFGRALSKNPADRFRSCREFVGTLAQAMTTSPESPFTMLFSDGSLGTTRTFGITQLSHGPPGGASGSPDSSKAAGGHSSIAALTPTRQFDFTGQIVDDASNLPKIDGLVQRMIWASLQNITPLAPTGGADVTDLFCRFPVKANRATLSRKIAEFAADFSAKLSVGLNAEFRLSMYPATGWLGRIIDRPNPIQVVITLPTMENGDGVSGEVTAIALGSGGKAGEFEAERHAFSVQVLRRLRAALSDDSEKRKSTRYPVGTPLLIYPVDARLGESAKQRRRVASTFRIADAAFGRFRDSFITRFTFDSYIIRRPTVLVASAQSSDARGTTRISSKWAADLPPTIELSAIMCQGRSQVSP